MLPHGTKVSSDDAIICVASHSRSHSLHWPTSPMPGTSMRAIRRDWQLRLLKRERLGNSMTETGTVSALFNKKVQVSWSDCLTEFPTVHYLLWEISWRPAWPWLHWLHALQPGQAHPKVVFPCQQYGSWRHSSPATSSNVPQLLVAMTYNSLTLAPQCTALP